MSLNLVTLLYLIASVCFIQALKGLSHPTTSIRGNLFGMVGMAIAALTTAALIVRLADGHLVGLAWVLLGLLAGGGYGAYRAKTVVKHGVTLVGETNLAALVAADASALYARNVLDFLKLVITKEGTFNVPMDDDIVAACLMTQGGEVKRK